MSQAVAVSQDTFQHDVLESGTPVLVDFWADWCAPCKMISPIVEQIANENTGRLKVVKVDADEAQDVMMAYGIFSIPTLILFKDGKDVARVSGFQPKERIMTQFKPFLG